MTRTIAVAIALATVLMSTAAYATYVPPRDDVQAPRGQDPTAPRDRQDDVQAPRGSTIVSPR
jgi:hypothetical protein